MTTAVPAIQFSQPSASPVSLLSVYDIAPGGVQSVSGYSQVTHHQQQGYQSTVNASNLAEDVSSGAVYVQQQQQQTTPASDELYYIYYQDPDKDPLYGKKVYDTRAAPPEDYAVAVPETLDASRVRPTHAQYVPVEQLPLYDYDSGVDLYRGERNNEDYDYPQQFYNNYKDIGGQSSVSFNLNVGGKSTGYNYNL